MTNRPVASTTRALDGIATDERGPMARIRSPSVTTTASATGDSNGPAWAGDAAAALAFLLVGAGLHTVQTVGLALATDLAPPEKQPKVVALLCMMMLLGMVGSALLFGALLADFSEVKLIQVVQGAAVVTMDKPVEPTRAQLTCDMPVELEEIVGLRR